MTARVFHAVVCLLLSLTLLTRGWRRRPDGCPPDWATTLTEAKQFTFDGRHKDAYRVTGTGGEQPTRSVADGHVGSESSTSRWVANRCAATGVVRSRRSTRPPGTFSRASSSTGGENAELVVRALLDLLELLGREEDRRKTIAAAVTRYRGTAGAAHWCCGAAGVPRRHGHQCPAASSPGRHPTGQYVRTARLCGLPGRPGGPGPAHGEGRAGHRSECAGDEAVKMHPSRSTRGRQVGRIKSQLAIAATRSGRRKRPAADKPASRARSCDRLCAIGLLGRLFHRLFAPTLDALGRLRAGRILACCQPIWCRPLAAARRSSDTAITSR